MQERKLAGDIYINNLLTDLQTAETEGQELQKEFDWILTLPPSAFASQEMLDWLRRDTAALAGDTEGDTDSELGLEISPESRVTGARTRPQGSVLLPDQVHPSPDQARSESHCSQDIQCSVQCLYCRSSSTGSTSSGISSDLHSLVSPEPDSKSSSSSSLKPPLPPKRLAASLAPGLKLPDSGEKFLSAGDNDDNNSDTGLSSLNSSAEEQYTLDTLV